jgi:hypothetical protein
MHSDADYLNFSAGPELAKRGYTVLCANTTGYNGPMDGKILNAKAAVQYLRSLPGVKKVVLLGHSGGATLMTAYQALAENGVKAFQGPEKISKTPDSLDGLPAADGVLLLDANFGISSMMLFSLDPAVSSENSASQLKSEFDQLSPANGYDPSGSHYSADFIKKFQSAQAERNARLIQTAQDRQKLIDAGKGEYKDDEPMIVPGASQVAPNNKLYPLDVRLLSHTRKAWPLIHADGSITNEVVHTVRLPMKIPNFTQSFGMGALNTTVKSFLSSYAIRTKPDFSVGEDGVTGIDWTSSINNPPGNVQSISVPILMLGMTGSWEFMAAEVIYENAKSADKALQFIEGATHMIAPNKAAEKTPGQFGDTIKTTYDAADRWLSQSGRFF